LKLDKEMFTLEIWTKICWQRTKRWQRR